MNEQTNYDLNNFIYREYAEGSFTNRNHFYEDSPLQVFVNEEEHYRSLYLFDLHLIEYFRSNSDEKHNGSVRGFKGPHYASEIIFDFDGTELNEVLEEVRLFSLYLNETFNIPPENIDIAFSGNKGFHIAVATLYINYFQPSENLNEIIRLMVSEICEKSKFIDLSIYKITGLIRTANSINKKSNLYKIPLTYEELFTLDIAAIKVLAESPRQSFSKKHKIIEASESLTRLYLSCKEIVEKSELGYESNSADATENLAELPQLSEVVEFLKGKIDNYEDWMKCGLALSSLIGDDKTKIPVVKKYFYEISSDNPHYPDDNLNNIEKNLNRFILYYSTDKKRPIRINTLFHIAKKYGYTFSEEVSPNTAARVVDKEIRFDINHLHNSAFKELLRYYENQSSSPIEYLLTGQLTAIAGTIGKRAYFKMSDYFNVNLNLYAVIIGPSSIMKKTSALNLVTLEMHKIAKLSNNNDAGVVSTEGSVNDITLRLKNNANILLPEDSTVESLADILTQTENGLIKHSEFGSMLVQLNRSYSGDSKQFLTSLYDVPETHKITRVTKESKTLIRPCISILGASTIEWIRVNSDFHDIYSGFFARFLYSIRNQNDKEPIPLFQLKNRDNNNTFSVSPKVIFENLATLQMDTILKVSPEAQVIYTEYEGSMYNLMNKWTHSAENSFIQRLIISTLKFAGIIALTDERTEVKKNDMEDAIIIADYFRKNITALLGSELNQTEFSLKEKRILELIKLSPPKITRSNLLRKSGLQAKDLAEVIKNLLEKEFIGEIKEKIPGTFKPSTSYFIIENMEV